MKIGFLLPTAFALDHPGNGIRVQAQAQARALHALGHEVIELNPWTPMDVGSLDVVHFFLGGYPMFMIEDAGATVVKHLVWAPIIDSNEPNWRYRLAARVGQLVPKIHTVPGVFRSQAQASSLVVVRSSHERDRIVHGLGVDPGKVELVRNGVNLPGNPDPARVRSAYALPEQFLLHVSSYTQTRKNVLRLIHAAGRAGLPLVIAGTAHEGPQLRALRNAAACYKGIHFLGFLPRELLTSLCAACRVFCLPSVHEGTGLAALEAAACGAGVVITRKGGPPDYFGDLAYYCDPFDIQSIQRALETAWKSPKGDSLRRHVTTNLTWAQSAEQLVHAYARHCIS